MQSQTPLREPPEPPLRSLVGNTYRFMMHAALPNGPEAVRPCCMEAPGDHLRPQPFVRNCAYRKSHVQTQQYIERQQTSKLLLHSAVDRRKLRSVVRKPSCAQAPLLHVAAGPGDKVCWPGASLDFP